MLWFCNLIKKLLKTEFFFLSSLLGILLLPYLILVRVKNSILVMYLIYFLVVFFFPLWNYSPRLIQLRTLHYPIHHHGMKIPSLTSIQDQDLLLRLVKLNQSRYWELTFFFFFPLKEYLYKNCSSKSFCLELNLSFCRDCLGPCT